MNLMRASVCLLMFLTVSAAAGQEPQRQSPNPYRPGSSSGEPAQKPTVVGTGEGRVVIIDVPATSYREVGRAQVSYFEESDTTEVRDELTVYKSRGQSVNMSLVYTAKGKRVVRPEVVSVGMAFLTDKAGAEKIKGFTLEAGGRSIALDGLTVEDVGYDFDAKKYFRDMEGTIPFALFEQIANGAALKVHAGDLVFEFDESNREALRDMLKVIEHPAK